jgi:hypothetical protein
LFGACLCVACADPEVQDAEPTERSAIEQSAGLVEQPEHFDWSGHYLLALSTVLAPEQPLLFAIDAQVASDLALVDLHVQPLTPDAVGDSRSPTGDPFDLDDVPYAEDGTFEVDLGEVSVAGSANPITGTDIAAQVQLHASTYRAADEVPQHFCGDATGMVSQPIPLDLQRSTFGAVLTEEDKEAKPMLRCPE